MTVYSEGAFSAWLLQWLKPWAFRRSNVAAEAATHKLIGTKTVANCFDEDRLSEGRFKH